MKRFTILWYLLLFAMIPRLSAQTAVPVGAGSYASAIPASKNVDTDSRTRYVLSGVTGAYPTNKWWTALMTTNLLGSNGGAYHIWAEPASFTVQSYGLGMHYATTWVGDADHQLMASPDPLRISAAGFTPAGSQLVKQWSDWTVAFRLQESAAKYMDITLGHGMPYAWVEYTGITNPQVSTTNAPAAYFNTAGSTQTFPFTGDQLGIEWDGRFYAVFAPAGTQFTLSGSTVSITFASGARQFLVYAVLPSRAALSTFYANAYSIPRNTTVTPTYDEENGLLHTDWVITTELLKAGATGNIIQGWLPHHYKNTTYNAALNGFEYATPRGKMKCAVGSSFRFTYPFKGVLAQLPAPEVITGSNPYSAATLNQRISDYATTAGFGGDTYGGGKDMTMAAQFLTYAAEVNHTSKTTISTKLKAELVNWFTYTPGENNKYYARMPGWGALLGEDHGYGSEQFNDHHFHYGYHVYAAAILGMYDADFLSQYGAMAKLVTKEYANWDRTDNNFPYLRNLDIWEGHSWANGGYGYNPPFGPDQESTSEAMMSWAGVFLLGSVMNDAELRKVGAMGYVMEAAATSEYWFNRDNDNFPPAWGPAGKLASIVHGSQLEYQTFFGLNPAYVHGIQYIPLLPSSYYLVKNPTAANTEFEYMRTRSVSTGYGDLGSFSPNPVDKLWDNLAVRYISLFDAERAAAQPAMGTTAGELGLTYYQVHTNRNLGRFAWDYHIGAAQSGVFFNTALNQYTYMAYNPATTTKVFNVYQGSTIKGTITVPARTFYSTHVLNSGPSNPDPDPDPDPTGCTGTAVNGDYSYEVATVNGVVTWKFIPLSPIAGSTLAIIYVRAGTSGVYPGYTMSASGSNFTFSQANTNNSALSFYFTYRVGNTGEERNSSANPHAYTVGTVCSGTLSLNSLSTAALQQAAKEDNGLRIYPNPAQEQLYITGLTSNNKRLISIYDGTGKKVYVVYATVASINISHLPAGMYWLECVEGNQRRVKSFIKQ